uniref:TPA-induced transmembrane protein homolog n=1 Tax=Semicossyphus pulcher TaxID=241346 RepID=UPI0037E8DABC
MDIPMQTFRTNGDHGVTYSPNERVTGNGDSVPYVIPEATETDVLLSVQTDSCNGEIPSLHAAEPQRNLGNTSAEATSYNGEMLPTADAAESQSDLENASREIRCIKKELKEILFCKVRLWMAIILVFLLMFAVIIISLLVCSAIHEDVDERFDKSLFKCPLYFNGSFQLPNMVFTEEPFTQSFNESQTLAADLQGKLDDLYRSSPALGRYFSGIEIHAFRNGSVNADYLLKFVMPEERQDQLRNFILSREMVYNVFRQFLYDQESDSGQLYIDPVSLNMI